MEPSYICNNELVIVGSALADENYYLKAEVLLNNFVNKDKDNNIIKNYNLNDYEIAYKSARDRAECIKVNIVLN